MHRQLLRRTLPVGLAAALLAVTVAAPPVAAGPAPAAPDADRAGSPVTRALDTVAQRLAVDLDTLPGLPERLADGPVDLATLAPRTEFGQVVAAANAGILEAKGLPADSGSVLQVRLAEPATAPAFAAGAVPVVVPAGTDDHPSTLVGYESGGTAVSLDAAAPPRRPALLVGLDMQVVVPAGLAVLRERLAARGFGGEPDSGSRTAAGYWATKITAVRVSDVKEPWFKGDAEIFSVVGGFDLQGDANVRVVQMPYLDEGGRTYFPNQLLVHFTGYKYDLADVVMMEDDGDTNYQALAQALITALLTVADLGFYIPLVDPILNAMPASWWTDDPDYVDSWFTLSTGSSGRLHGASGNGWMDVVPHFVQEL